MEIRWLGEVELTFNPSFLPLPCPYIHGEKTARQVTRTGILVQELSTLFPPHAQSEEANSLAGRLPFRMGSVETFRLRVKLLNLQGRIIGEIYGNPVAR